MDELPEVKEKNMKAEHINLEEKNLIYEKELLYPQKLGP